MDKVSRPTILDTINDDKRRQAADRAEQTKPFHRELKLLYRWFNINPEGFVTTGDRLTHPDLAGYFMVDEWNLLAQVVHDSVIEITRAADILVKE